MESVVEGLLYVQGDLGITLKDIERILGIDEEEAKRIVLSLKNYYEDLLYSPVLCKDDAKIQ